jgi:hypothetical protein
MAYPATTVRAQTDVHPQREMPQQKSADRSRSGNETFQDHLKTYHGFVRGVALFAAHALAILILLYYFLM